MKNKKRLIIVSICIVLILIILGVVGFMIKNKQEESQSTGTEWGDLYYNKLKDSITNGNLKVAKENNAEATIAFIQVEENKNPIMITQFQTESQVPDSDNTVIMNNCNIFYIDENNDVKQFYWGMSTKTDIEYLYNIKDDKYLWYVKEDNSENFPTDSYIPFTQYMEYQEKLYHAGGNTEERDKIYSEIKNNETKVFKNETYNTTTDTYKYDDIFVKVDDMQNYSSKTYLSTPLKVINELIRKAINEKYKNYNEILTAEVKQNVSNKLQEIENKKEEAKKVAEEEARKKAEEEAQRKAQEEASKVLKAGKYTLKYGTYKGSGTNYNSGKKYNNTFVLKSDGTCDYTEIIGGETRKFSGTYKVSKDTWYGIEVTGPEGAFDCLITTWTNGETDMFAIGQNSLSAFEMQMTYVGN